MARRFLLYAIAAVVLTPGLFEVSPAAGAPAQVTTPPLACPANLRPTPAQTEGPYYKTNTPERRSLLEPGMPGTRLILTGYVVTADCKPIARAWLDFWQADDAGVYDNAGYRLRGHQFTDNAGVYYLETVLPGLYPGRTRHIHVKVRAPDGPAITTQLYFPGESSNQRDGIFRPELIVSIRDAADGKVATFNFVLAVR